MPRLVSGRPDAGAALKPVTDWSDCVVAIARSRDRDRFAALFAHFAPRCKSFFLRLGASPGVAEDLAQETLLIVWRKADRFDPARAQASTWIYTIARNLRIDMQRRERDPAKLAEFFEAAPEPLASDRMLSAEQEKRVHTALAFASGRSGRRHPPVLLRRSAACRDCECALNIPLGTVKSRVRLAMSRLRAMIEDRQ